MRALWPWLVTALMTLPVVGLVFVQPHLSAALLFILLPGAIASILFASSSTRRIRPGSSGSGVSGSLMI